MSPHPTIEPHPHTGAKCPVTGRDHYAFCPPQEGDIRSVCPALNTMANHGYIPRSGKGLSWTMIVQGLRKCYHLSLPLAMFLATGGYITIRRIPFPFRQTNLAQFDLHNGTEHDASLVHRDCPPGEKYPSTEVVPEWVQELVGDIEPKVDQESIENAFMDEKDVARARIRREKLSPPLDPLHAELARGEMAIILGVWNKHHDSPPSSGQGKFGAPLPWILQWLQYEQLPEGWKPDHTQTMRNVMKRSKLMRETMKEIRARDEKQKQKQN